MSSVFSYWTFFALFYLIILTYQDYKKMLVDDRFNFFMLAMSLSLASHAKPAFFYLLTLIAILGVLYYFLKRYNVIGAGDVSAISWLFLGYGILGIGTFSGFAVIFTVCTLIYWGMARIVWAAYFNRKGGVNGLKKPFKLPFFAILLICHVWAAFIFKIW